MIICRPSIGGSASTLAIGAVSVLTRCKSEADVLVRHFAAAKAQRHLDLVALLEETTDRAHLDVVVVVVDARAELDLLDLDDLLALALLGRLLLLEEAVLPEVEDLADRRGRVGDDLDEIEPASSARRCASAIDDAPILPFGVDKLDLNGADVSIDPRAAFLRRRGRFHGTTNGHLLGSLIRAPLGARKRPA